MKFSADTLRSTSRNFERALVSRELKLQYQQSQNLWAQIAVGKNYSAASAQAKDRGFVEARTVSKETICELLASSNRHVTQDVTAEIYSAAIADDLETLSHSLSAILAWLRKHPSYHVASLVGEPVACLGLMDSEHAGFIPVGTAEFLSLRSEELTWIRENSEFVADVLNTLAGRTENQCEDIRLANMRATYAQEDEIFATFITGAGKAISDTIGAKILHESGPDNLASAGTLDYDEIHWAVYGVFEARIQQEDTTWLKPDCGLAEAVIDHVSGRIRETLRLIADGIFPEEAMSAPERLLADTAWHAMRRFMKTGN
jgi:hypothetical protein